MKVPSSNHLEMVMTDKNNFMSSLLKNINYSSHFDKFGKTWLRYKNAIMLLYNAIMHPSAQGCALLPVLIFLAVLSSPETHHHSDLYQSVDGQPTIYSLRHPWLLTCFGLELPEVLPISMSIIFFTELEKRVLYCTK